MNSQPPNPESGQNENASEGFGSAEEMRNLVPDRRWPDDDKTREIAHEVDRRLGDFEPTQEASGYLIAAEELHLAPTSHIPRKWRDEDARRLAPESHEEGHEERRHLMSQRDTDKITGLGNRRALDKALPEAERDSAVSIINFDANNFGDINKLHGELAGDAAVVAVAEAIYEAAAKYGYARRAFRRGGDEFIVLAPNEVAQQIADEACRLLDERLQSDEPLMLTVDLTDAAGEIVAQEVREFDTGIYRDLEVSLSGVTGQTFEETSIAIQAVKQERKARDKASREKGPEDTPAPE